MKRFFDDKKVVLVIGVLSLVVLAYLVSSLASLEFKPAVPFTFEKTDVTPGGPPQLPQFSYLFLMILFAALLVGIYLMLPKDQRKRYLSGLIQFLFLGILAIFLITRSGTTEIIPEQTQAYGTPVPPIDTDPTEIPLPDVTPAPFTPPEVSPWTSFLIALTVLVPVGLGVWWFFLRKKKDEAPYSELAEIAQSALDDLESGKDWGEAVLNCYSRMNKAIEGERGIRRRAYLTPSEFVVVLDRARLPGDAVRRLTVLFERVRYGAKQSTQTDIDEAVACLTEIVTACKGAM